MELLKQLALYLKEDKTQQYFQQVENSEDLYILLILVMDNLFNNICIVLIEPSRSGNVGSTARAMLNMGLKTYGL